MINKLHSEKKSNLLKIFTLTFFMIFFGSLITISGYNTAGAKNSNLVGYWDFNEGSGIIVTDNSGNGNNGTLINNPVWVDGKYGKALSFTGSNYVQVLDNSSLDMTSEVTLEAWVYPRALVDGSGFDSHVVSRCDSGNGGHRYEFGTHSSGKWHYGVYTGGYDFWLSNANVSLNTWSHVAVTYNGSLVCLYINGELDSSHAQSGKIFTTTSPLGIGVKTSGPYGGPTPSAYFNGIVDEVRIYNKALSQQELQIDMQNITTPTTPTKGTPGFETVITITSVATAGALVAFFRRYGRGR